MGPDVVEGLCGKRRKKIVNLRPTQDGGPSESIIGPDSRDARRRGVEGNPAPLSPTVTDDVPTSFGRRRQPSRKLQIHVSEARDPRP